MLKRTFTRMFPDPFAGMADEHRREFIRQTAFINFTRARVFSAILGALQLPLILVDHQNKAKGLWASTPGYRSLYVLHLVIGAAFLLYSFSAYAIRPRQPADIALRHRVMVILFAALGLFLSVAVSVNDQLIHGQITVYLIAAFWMAAGLSLDAVTSFLLYGAVTALLMAGLQLYQQDAAVLLGHAINGPLLSLLAWLLSGSLYRAREREFVQGTIIQQQRLQVKELELRQLMLEREKLHEAVEQSTRSLQESEAKFRTLAETSTAAIIIRRGGKILYANPAAETVTGYPVREILGREFPVLVHPEHRSMVQDWERLAMSGGAPSASCEFKVLRRSFDDRWVMMTAGRIEFEGGPSIIVMLYDINDRKKLEGRLRFARGSDERAVEAASLK
ncbi:MAG: PAS domain S-box protein [Nitrospirota bacterium]|mgnify:CR=1 FL=1